MKIPANYGQYNKKMKRTAKAATYFGRYVAKQVYE